MTVDKQNDARLAHIHAWVPQVLDGVGFTIDVASADASFRRYFRVTEATATPRTWIVMDAPPDKEDVGPYIKIAGMLVDAGVNAPRVLAQDLSAGFLLLSDLGSRMYLADLRAERHVDSLYEDALVALVRMQSHCTRVDELPPYDEALLRREMLLFPEWFMKTHLGLVIDGDIERALESTFAVLVESALSQPCAFVHRDYHSRNLMITDGDTNYGPNPGVLDFQDAVHGPVTYDLVSLLRDCYVAWPVERVHGWVRRYRELALNAGVRVGESESELLRWFDLMGIQRHLKAIGIFARLWHRDGKRGYLGDIPRTLNYIRSVAPRYPELTPLVTLVDAHIAPQLARRSEAEAARGST